MKIDETRRYNMAGRPQSRLAGEGLLGNNRYLTAANPNMSDGVKATLGIQRYPLKIKAMPVRLDAPHNPPEGTLDAAPGHATRR